MVTFASSHRSPDEGAQTQFCANTSSPSGNQAVTIKKVLATVGYTLNIDEKGPLEQTLTKEELPEDTANSKDGVFGKRNYDNLEGCLALSTFFQKPKYRFLISVGANAGMPRTVASLMDTGAGLNHFNNSFLPPICL